MLFIWKTVNAINYLSIIRAKISKLRIWVFKWTATENGKASENTEKHVFVLDSFCKYPMPKNIYARPMCTLYLFLPVWMWLRVGVRKATQHTDQWNCACLSISILLSLCIAITSFLSNTRTLQVAKFLCCSFFSSHFQLNSQQEQLNVKQRALSIYLIRTVLHNVIHVIIGSFFRSRMLF